MLDTVWQVSMLEASPPGQFARGKVDPREAGRRGAIERERRRRERLTTAREALEADATDVALQAVRVAMGREAVSSIQAAMMRDVLDRTIGRAPEHFNVTADSSERLVELLAILDEPMTQPQNPARELPGTGVVRSTLDKT
jgi:hypothetical protein